MAVETPLGTDIHVSLRERGTAKIYYPGLPEITFTGRQCIIQLSNQTLGEVDGIFSADLDSLEIGGVTWVSKTASVLNVRAPRFTIAAPDDMAVALNSSVITNATYFENAYSYGGN